MRIYSITKNNIDRFTSLSEDGEELKKAVESLWDNGLSKPEWCFVLEEGGRIMGRIGYWAPRENQSDARSFGLNLPRERDILHSTGNALLRGSAGLLKEQGVKSVNFQLHSDEGNNFAATRELF